MTADLISPRPTALEQATADTHQAALDALDHDAVMDAVVWLSAHLAAFGRTVVPAAARLTEVAPAREHDANLHRLQQLLRIAERRHSGDALAAAIDAPRLRATLRSAARDYAAAERRLVEVVVATSSTDVHSSTRRPGRIRTPRTTESSARSRSGSTRCETA
jgi:hypothetical protein